MSDNKENQVPNFIENLNRNDKIPNQILNRIPNQISNQVLNQIPNQISNYEQENEIEFQDQEEEKRFKNGVNINDLCDDLMILIFKNFNVEQLFTIEKVCKRWYNLAALNRRNCLCLSLLGAQLNEDRKHWCNNRLHNCNLKQKYSFGNFTYLIEKILPKYESVQTLHLNLENLQSNQKRILLDSIASKFDNLLHFQLQVHQKSKSTYRQLIEQSFVCANRLQHLILSNTVNYETGDLNDLNRELDCNERSNDKDKYLNSVYQYAHFKIPCKFPHLKSFHSDFRSLQLPSEENLSESYTLKFLNCLRLNKCIIEEQEFICLYKLFPNLEHLSIHQLNAKQCLMLTTLFSNSIQTLRVNEIDPTDFVCILNHLCSMRKLRYLKLICTRLHYNRAVRNAILKLQRNCPLLQKFILNKLHVQANALDDHIGYWRTFDIINKILTRFYDLKYIDLNKLELFWPEIDLKHFLSALRHIRTLYFVTDNLIFANFQCLFDKTSKLRTLHFDYQNSNNSKSILLNLVQYSPKLRVLKLNQVEFSHSFMAELPKCCPNLVLLEINPKRFMTHPCKYNFHKLSNLNNLSQLCLSNMRIHDRDLSLIVKTCVNLAKLHITSSSGLNGNTVYALHLKALTNPDVNYELNVDSLVDTKYFNFYLVNNFLTSIDNYSFSKINFEPFQNLIIFTPGTEPTFLNVVEWDGQTLKFKDFKKITQYFSNMKYYYIKHTDKNKEARWAELKKQDDTLVPSRNNKILVEFL